MDHQLSHSVHRESTTQINTFYTVHKHTDIKKYVVAKTFVLLVSLALRSDDYVQLKHFYLTYFCIFPPHALIYQMKELTLRYQKITR